MARTSDKALTVLRFTSKLQGNIDWAVITDDKQIIACVTTPTYYGDIRLSFKGILRCAEAAYPSHQYTFYFRQLLSAGSADFHLPYGRISIVINIEVNLSQRVLQSCGPFVDSANAFSISKLYCNCPSIVI